MLFQVYDFLSSVEHKRRCLAKYPSFLTMKVDGQNFRSLFTGNIAGLTVTVTMYGLTLY